MHLTYSVLDSCNYIRSKIPVVLWYLQLGFLTLLPAIAQATNYGPLTIRQNSSLQIGSPSDNLSLAMQGDGNLVLYRNGTALWSSNTSGQNCGSNDCVALFQGDGNFVVYNWPTPIWNSQTGGNQGAQLVLTDRLPYIQIVGPDQSILWGK